MIFGRSFNNISCFWLAEAWNFQNLFWIFSESTSPNDFNLVQYDLCELLNKDSSYCFDLEGKMVAMGYIYIWLVESYRSKLYLLHSTNDLCEVLYRFLNFVPVKTCRYSILIFETGSVESVVLYSTGRWPLSQDNGKHMTMMGKCFWNNKKTCLKCSWCCPLKMYTNRR
jgi:hypothetical protein